MQARSLQKTMAGYLSFNITSYYIGWVFEDIGKKQ